ncbi:MAG: SEL1-like repeat protein [Sulfuricaulis sp.]|uniref:tetratricopeptide repeat protein n=1 Tax=Sulfuricaulis sp. TaxID=2003553 RepID=UPI0025D63F59|nr:SEL1-like repeat protein [Sulfuricaulis sp.]MCR4345714.1 SEL1-like repeat protein [Sulfuricaulis sp.]
MKPAIVILILGLSAPLLAGAQDSPSLEQMHAAAERGNADAQLEMGILYEFGYNMPKNHATALAWYLRAADQGNVLAAKRRDQIKSGMKPEEIDAAQKLSQEPAAQKSPSTATSPPAEPAPAPREPAPAAEAPPAGLPDVDKPSDKP